MLAGFATTTDGSGRFVLENVRPGRNYRLLATKAGFVDGSLPAQLTLNGGDIVRNLIIEMREQGVVTGRVIDANGNPLVSALVTLQQSRYANGLRQMASIAAQTTDDRGIYRFANVSPGRYYVVANDQVNRREEVDRNIQSGQLANIRTYYPSADTIDAAKAIDVAGNEARSTDILMRRAGTFGLRGRVTDEDTGAPVPDARVLIVAVNGASVRANPFSRQSAVDGSFQFTGLPTASYTLEVAPPALPGTNRRIGRAEATIAGSDVSGVAIRVGNGIGIRGTVRVEGGSLPSSFFSVARSVLLIEGPERAALRLRGRVMSDGTFTIDAFPGRYLVSFTELPEDLYVKSINSGNSEIIHSSLDLSSSRGAVLTIILSNKPAVIEGLVRDSKGEVVKGMPVAVWPKDVDSGDSTGGIRHVVTDQNGSYRFASLPPGQYYIAAFPGVELGLLESHDFVSGFNSESARIELAEGARSKLDAPILAAEKIAAEVAKLP
jgi:protocatechuate 3,4-dioxygenase beta subunit